MNNNEISSVIDRALKEASLKHSLTTKTVMMLIKENLKEKASC